MLIFPYTYGLDFERELLKAGKDKAYASVFKRPPVSTREVMEPVAYLANENLPPVNPPDIEKLMGSGWEMYDVGSIGEFDVAVMAEQFGDTATSKMIYPGWRGGYYYAVKKKGVDVKGPGDLGMVFVTKWANPDAESSFAHLYMASVKKRYSDVQAVAPGPAPDTDNAVRYPTRWHTSEGDVYVENQGDLLLVFESMDEASVNKLRAAIIGKK